MDQAVQQLDSPMTVAQFLALDPPDNRMWQLVDGIPLAMAPPSWRHQALLGEIHGVIRAHLLDLGSPCSSLPTPGIVTPKHADRNMRIPDLAVTCSDPGRTQLVVATPERRRLRWVHRSGVRIGLGGR